MGTVTLKIGDGTAKFKPATVCPAVLHLVMLLSLLATNLFAFYAFTYHPPRPTAAAAAAGDRRHHLQNISDHVSLILREINASQKQLAAMEEQLLGFHLPDPAARLSTPAELRLFLRRHPLPLGKDAKTGLSEMSSSVGHSCAAPAAANLLAQFMTYSHAAPCPDDSPLAQKLLLQGCEPLPRRRCFARSPEKSNLSPFPTSLWAPVSDGVLSWSGLGCKNLSCLLKRATIENRLQDLDLGSNGYDRLRWIKPRSKNDFPIDDVLAMAGNGEVRIGFDINGGSGSFAAVMAEKNVTIATSTLNVGAPFSDFVAARGLFPLFISPNQRFPFYDGVFDLVHGGRVLEEASEMVKMEFLMFDIDRVLRADGLFWLDNYHCVDDGSKNSLTQLIDRFGYRKLRWVVGTKQDSSNKGKPKVYLSAVLQKPVRK